MSRLIVASLSLLISVATSTFEYPKNSGNYLSSLKPIVSGVSPLQRVRDRRTTHWESRTNSKLDDDSTDDDRDEGHRRISYPPLGYSRRTEQSVKLSDAIDVTSGSIDDDSRSDQDCFSRKPMVLVTFGDAKRTLRDLRNLQKSQAYLDTFGSVRCRRRIDDWNVQQPMYVEEPGWVVIDLDGQSNQRYSTNQQDPFYVARGKRSLLTSETRDKREDDKEAASNNTPDKFDVEDKRLSSDVPRKDDSTAIGRIKRQIFNEAQSRLPIVDEGLPNLPGLLVGKSRTNGYMQLRDKHSDILDILDEPFFISRGKKRTLRMGLFEWNNRYAKALENFDVRKRNLEDYFSRTSTSERSDECRSSWSQCNVESSMTKGSGRLAGGLPYRDRRGVMEDLLKDTDPFYIARGKRSMPDVVQFLEEKKSDLAPSTSTETTMSANESINDINSSVGVVEH